MFHKNFDYIFGIRKKNYIRYNYQIEKYKFSVAQCYYSIFCFDVSEQDEKLAMNGVNVTIEIENDTEFKAKYYCVILTENQVNIELETGKMSTLS